MMERINIVKLSILPKAIYRFNAAAAAKSLQSCLTLCDPIDGSAPGFQSLGFSRQEYWSGLPFHSPMHESKKWKWSRSVVSDSSQLHGLQPTRLLHPLGCLLTRFNAIPIKISMALFFYRNKAKNPKIFMETLKTQTVKPIFKKKNTRGVLLPDFKVY